MKHVSILILLFLTALFTACSDDEMGHTPDPKGIVLELTTGSFDTKSHLYSQSNLHHVTKVYAILYYCGETTLTAVDPDNATVVASQLLQKDGAIWNPSKDKENGEGQTQVESFELVLPEENLTLVPGKYLVLCVGTDDVSDKTFGLTYEGAAIPAFAQKGATLASAQAVLQGTPNQDPIAYDQDPAADAEGKLKDKDLIRYGHPEMAHSEFFAGWKAFNFNPDDLNVVQVELRRRVAGVLCYLSDIPYKLNKDAVPYRVTKVRLNLFAEQNAQIGLMSDITTDGKPSSTDFGKPIDGQNVCHTLCEFDLMGFDSQKGPSGTGDLLYRIPTAHLNGRFQLENTILMGAYLLPIKNETQQVTMNVELLGYEYDDADKKDHIKDEQGPDKVEPTVIKSFPAIYDGLVNPKVYSIHPNMIYHIGHKLDNNNTEGDYPESLAGTKVIVGAYTWEPCDVTVEFPDVPIVPLLALYNQDRQRYETEGNEKGSYFIFDCVGSINKDYLKITPSILNPKWKLIVMDKNANQPWITFWDENSQKYVAELTGSGAQNVYVRINPYVDPHDRQEIRTVELMLSALDDSGIVIDDAFSKLSIQQYKAEIVQIDEGFRGISHYDYGTKRNPVTGEVISQGEKIQWGYFRSLNVTPSYEDGLKNYKEFITHTWIDNFEKSAIQVASMDKWGDEVYVDYEEAESDDPYWYLPARDELLEFMKINDRLKQPLKREQFYWTCNQAGYYLEAMACILSSKGPTWYREKKDNYYYVRQVCHAE